MDIRKFSRINEVGKQQQQKNASSIKTMWRYEEKRRWTHLNSFIWLKLCADPIKTRLNPWQIAFCLSVCIECTQRAYNATWRMRVIWLRCVCVCLYVYIYIYNAPKWKTNIKPLYIQRKRWVYRTKTLITDPAHIVFAVASCGRRQTKTFFSRIFIRESKPLNYGSDWRAERAICSPGIHTIHIAFVRLLWPHLCYVWSNGDR